MATIRERINEKGTITYYVDIRKKGHSIHKGFCDKETAEMYAWYKEKLIEEMENFEVPLKDLITIEDALQIKLKLLETEKRNPTYLRDLLEDLREIEKYIPRETYLKDITFNMLGEMCKGFEKTVVYRGGAGKKARGPSGSPRAMSPHSIRRRLMSLSMLTNVANAHTQAGITNEVSSFIAYFRKNYLETQKGKEENGI